MPKNFDTRRPCKVGLSACNNRPQPPRPKCWEGFWGLQKIVACSQSYLPGAFCHRVLGTVSSLHPTSLIATLDSFWDGVIPTSYLMNFTLVSLIFQAISSRWIDHQEVDAYVLCMQIDPQGPDLKEPMKLVIIK